MKPAAPTSSQPDPSRPDSPAAGCIVLSPRARSARHLTESLARVDALMQATGLPHLPVASAPLPRLVLERTGVRLETADGVVHSHPGMGLVRLRRLVRADEHDPLVDFAGLRPGDTVLDGTFGFGQDALVLAWAVGETGRVVALEASPLLTGLALEGMPRWPEPGATMARRIALHCTDTRSYLVAAPDRSVDVIYLDPMFRSPRSAAPDFVVLRGLAETAPLSAETLEHARRVARRCVVIKDAWPGHELVRLGREPEDRLRRADVVYGVWPAA